MSHLETTSSVAQVSCQNKLLHGTESCMNCVPVQGIQEDGKMYY